MVSGRGHGMEGMTPPPHTQTLRAPIVAPMCFSLVRHPSLSLKSAGQRLTRLWEKTLPPLARFRSRHGGPLQWGFAGGQVCLEGCRVKVKVKCSGALPNSSVTVIPT